jgi:hypothetical protein
MNLVTSHFALGLALLVGGGGLVATGWTPTQSKRETVPVSVRDNPASYKPSYGLFWGYHVIYTTSGGGYRSGK